MNTQPIVQRKASPLQWQMFGHQDLAGCSHKSLRDFRKTPLAFYKSAMPIFGVFQNYVAHEDVHL